MSGAKNLGGLLANTEWLVFMDLDSYFTETELLKLFHNQEKGRRMLFRRRKADGFHVGMTLIHRESFLKIGLYDEDFAGNYGWEDVEFNNRASHRGVSETLLGHITLDHIPDACSDAAPRERDLDTNEALLFHKVGKKLVPMNHLRFNWYKVF